ncbi:YeaC family protein [Zhongshania sp.]|uniref:YeaC family protein n=1 Tax=Zhongshania sp. TaxID=1971902 RepID=UPI0035697715
MDFEQLVDNITPAIYEGLKRAVEIGKWPDGRVLTVEQREHCMAGVIAYDLKTQHETDRVGYIDRGKKAEGELCGDDHDHDDGDQILKWAE